MTNLYLILYEDYCLFNRQPFINSAVFAIFFWYATIELTEHFWQTNTMIYQDVFSCVPNDLIHSRYLVATILFQYYFVRVAAFSGTYLWEHLGELHILAFSETRWPCRTQFRQSIAYWKEKIGHTTIDLGVAQEKLETYQDGDLKGTDPMDRLQLVRGHLVSFPLDFMCQEDLRPYFSESEYYTSPQVFH